MNLTMYLWLLAAGLISEVISITVENATSTYGQYRKWNVALNGSLEFEFKTDQPNGLLLYTDDGGTYDFFEIKLVEGALRLRYNLGGGAQIITIGRELNDNHWHKVEIHRKDDRTTLMLDGKEHTRKSKGKEFEFGNLASNSDVYVGGMPAWYTTKLTRLALPSVIFEPRFNGAIRNLIYIDSESTIPKRQRIKRSNGRERLGHGAKSASLTFSASDICVAEDPCKNGGICITTDGGPICDCRNLEFEGPFCEKEKAPSEASFLGKEFIEYNLTITTNEPTVTTQETISFSFQTKYSNGFLFHSGTGEDYLNIAIKDGGVSVVMKVAIGKLNMYIKPNKIRFDDYRWHKIYLHRRILAVSTPYIFFLEDRGIINPTKNETTTIISHKCSFKMTGEDERSPISAVTSFCKVTVTVDDIYTEHSSTAGAFIMIPTSKLLVGGSDNPRILPGSSISTNFVGCLRKFVYETDKMKVDLFEIAKAGSKLVSIGGQLQFSCRPTDVSNAISFTTPQSYLVLPDWDAASAGSFAIKFRTTEPDGLLVFSKAQGESFSDVFAIEMVDGLVYMVMDLGGGSVKVQVGIGKMNDGFWHSVLLHREGRNGRVVVDVTGTEFTFPGDSRQLDLKGGLFIGGLPWHLHTPNSFPPNMWTSVLKRGFVGCIRDLILNDEPIDISFYAQEQDTVSIDPVCHVDDAHCAPNVCHNNGECTNGWNRFICDCSRTDFSGPTCSKAASAIQLNGSQTVMIKLPSNTKFEVEHLMIRFKTTKAVGLLFATTHENGDRVEVGIFGGKIRLLVQIKNVEKVVVNGDQLNDNTFHTLLYTRYGAYLILQVDNRRPIKIENVFTEYITLDVNHIHIGGYTEVEKDDLPMISTRLSNFTGFIQQLVFNGVDYIEAAKNSHLFEDDASMPKIRSDIVQTKQENIFGLHRAFTILSKNTFVGLPPVRSFSTLNVYFQFKTKEPNGLIVYSEGKGGDFLAVELVNGHIYVFLQLKNELIKIKDGARGSYSDNRWHLVTVSQPTAKIYALQVDETTVVAKQPQLVDNLRFPGLLYVGGIPNEKKNAGAKLVLRSKYGFQGCLANIHVNGDSPDLLQDALLPSTLIIPGCEGAGKRCNANTCDNRGECVQQWNSQVCDCSMTSYTGLTCSDESIAYEFGPGRGLITYTFPDDRLPDMKSDTLALGFVTDKDDAVLFRVESSSTNDYLEVEIVEGNIFVVYNMGTQDQPIGEIKTKVNDNAYHIIRFTRSGPNSTLQLDDYNLQKVFPTGHLLSVFNQQMRVQIGGRWNRTHQKIERPFSGIISGIVFNGLRLLDLAYEKDRRTEIRGEVSRISAVKNRMQDSMQYQQMQQPTTNSLVTIDDLVFSGADHACKGDDEDQCRVSLEINLDDLITPVYMEPTRKPPTIISSVDLKPGDDEDFGQSSGFGPDEEISIGTPSAELENEIIFNTTMPSMVTSFLPYVNTTNMTIVTLVGISTVPVANDSSTINDIRSPLKSIIDQSINRVIDEFSKLRGSSTTPPTTTISTTTTTKSTTMTTATTSTTPSTTTKFFNIVPPRVDHPRGHAHQTGTAITLIIISTILILIIILTIGVLLFNRKTNGNYKMEYQKSFDREQTDQRPYSCLLPKAPDGMVPPMQTTMPSVGRIKKRHDVKEWYV